MNLDGNIFNLAAYINKRRGYPTPPYDFSAWNLYDFCFRFFMPHDTEGMALSNPIYESYHNGGHTLTWRELKADLWINCFLAMDPPRLSPGSKCRFNTNYMFTDIKYHGLSSLSPTVDFRTIRTDVRNDVTATYEPVRNIPLYHVYQENRQSSMAGRDYFMDQEVLEDMYFWQHSSIKFLPKTGLKYTVFVDFIVEINNAIPASGSMLEDSDDGVFETRWEFLSGSYPTLPSDMQWIARAGNGEWNNFADACKRRDLEVITYDNFWN